MMMILMWALVVCYSTCVNGIDIDIKFHEYSALTLGTIYTKWDARGSTAVGTVDDDGVSGGALSSEFKLGEVFPIFYTNTTLGRNTYAGVTITPLSLLEGSLNICNGQVQLGMKMEMSVRLNAESEVEEDQEVVTFETEVMLTTEVVSTGMRMNEYSFFATFGSFTYNKPSSEAYNALFCSTVLPSCNGDLRLTGYISFSPKWPTCGRGMVNEVCPSPESKATTAYIVIGKYSKLSIGTYPIHQNYNYRSENSGGLGSVVSIRDNKVEVVFPQETMYIGDLYILPAQGNFTNPTNYSLAYIDIQLQDDFAGVYDVCTGAMDFVFDSIFYSIFGNLTITPLPVVTILTTETSEGPYDGKILEGERFDTLYPSYAYLVGCAGVDAVDDPLIDGILGLPGDACTEMPGYFYFSCASTDEVKRIYGNCV